MTVMVPIAMFGWIPVVMLLFVLLPPRRAVIAAFIGGWLFLPWKGYPIEGFIDYTKMTVVCLSALLGVAAFDTTRLVSFRPRWFDLPMVAWCLCPAASAIANGFGPYGALNQSLYQTITWGIPYLLGRVYFSDSEGLRELSIGIFIGGLIYVPLCLYEIRMSPQLNRMVYGYHHRGWGGRRLAGFRPEVFMNTGLELGLWMTAATLAGLWLWVTGALKQLWGIPVAWLVLAVMVTTLLCHSAGALALLALGGGALFVTKWTSRRYPLVLLIALVPTYMVLRGTGSWSGQTLVQVAERVFSERAAGSLNTRFSSENALIGKAIKRPVFGWSGWGRNRVLDEGGRRMVAMDGHWVITIGKTGLVGLASWAISALLPSVLFIWRFPKGAMLSPVLGPGMALAAVTVIFALDCLVNSMINPIYILAAGGLVALTPSTTRRSRVVRAQQPSRVLVSGAGGS